MQQPEPFVGIEEAARHLSVKVSWLYEQVRLNKLPSFKVGSFRRFKLSELDCWAATRREGPVLDPLLASQGDNGNPASHKGQSEPVNGQ